MTNAAIFKACMEYYNAVEKTYKVVEGFEILYRMPRAKH